MLRGMSLLAVYIVYKWATSPNGRGHAGFSISSQQVKASEAQVYDCLWLVTSRIWGVTMIRPYLAFPPLSLTFRSRGYINTIPSGRKKGVVVPFRALTINVITKNEEEVRNACPFMYPCPSDFKLDNWSIVEIPIAHKLTK